MISVPGGGVKRKRAGSRATFLQRRVARLPEAVRADAQKVLDKQGEIRERYRFLRDQRLNAMRIRIHGDYHLGQALYTGKDFVIIDFEGDPARPLSERRIKRSPLEDVASMLDSFYHASHAVPSRAPGPSGRLGLRPRGAPGASRPPRCRSGSGAARC